MFKRKKLDDIYETLLTIQNNERAKNADLQRVIEHKKMEISNLESENEGLRTQVEALRLQIEFTTNDCNKLVDELKTDNDKLHQYLDKVADILKEGQNTRLKRAKATKKDLMIEKMNKVSDEAKEKLK